MRDYLILSSTSKYPAPSEKIIQSVCRYYGLTKSELLSERRLRAYAYPRFVAMHLMRREGLSYQQIARRLKRKDHTTVIHGLRCIDRHPELFEAAEIIRNGN